ncbi:MAG: TIGR01777 family oxidoreductase [Myxococcota bacterium]
MAAASDTVLITGGTGLVGGALSRALLDAGHGARIVSRRASPRGLPAGAESCVWDGTKVAPEDLAGLRAVVHLAGEPVFGGLPTATHKARVRESRVASTRALVESLGACSDAERPRTFVCASAVGYYGDRGDTLLAEDADAGEGLLAEVCVDWEREALAAEALGVRTVRVRIGIVLAKDGGALPQLVLPFRFGLGGRLGDGRQWFPWIHLDDLTALLFAAITDEGWQGAVNGVAPQPVTNSELTRTLGRVLGRPTLLPVPGFAVRAALGELAGELLGSRRVVPRVAEERGFAFRYPELEPALADLL